MLKIIKELGEILIASSKAIDRTSIKGNEKDTHNPTKLRPVFNINA